MKTAERIQKILAREGLGSRREIEKWIGQGQITVNGAIAELGDKIDGSEKITINGKPIRIKQTKLDEIKVLIVNKPEGVIVTKSDPEHRKTLYELFPRSIQKKWITIGRLDINTSGLILLTTSGDLAHRLMHPSYEIEREYAVRVFGNVTPEKIAQLKSGVELDDGLALFNDIVESGGEGKNTWYHVLLKEGKNREVRRLWEAVGLTVSRLTRVRYGPIVLPSYLKTGQWQYLKEKQVNQLLEVTQLMSR